MQKRNKHKTASRPLLALLLLTCAALSSACGGPKDYWPLDKGNSWTYTARPKEGVVIGSVTYTVKNTTEENHAVKATIETTSENSPAPVAEATIVSDRGGIYEASRKSIQPMDFALVRQEIQISGKNPPYILKGKPEVGSEWDFTSKFKDLALNTEGEIRGSGKVEAKDTVDVLAGNFPSYKVRWYTTDASGNLLREQTYWFHKGLGPVKMEVSTSVGTVVLNLKKANIRGKNIGQWE